MVWCSNSCIVLFNQFRHRTKGGQGPAKNSIFLVGWGSNKGRSGEVGGMGSRIAPKKGAKKNYYYKIMHYKQFLAVPETDGVRIICENQTLYLRPLIKEYV